MSRGHRLVTRSDVEFVTPCGSFGAAAVGAQLRRKLPAVGSHLKENDMGYGLGAFLLAIGLVLALAVTDSISGVDLTTVGWILALVGILALVLTAVTANRSRGIRST